MTTIKVSPYEKGEMYRYLEYARVKKKEDLKNGIITEELYKYDKNKIDTLIQRINGINYENYERRKTIGDYIE